MLVCGIKQMMLVCSYASHLHANLRGRKSLGTQPACSDIGQDVLQYLPIVLETLSNKTAHQRMHELGSSGAWNLEADICTYM